MRQRNGVDPEKLSFANLLGVIPPERFFAEYWGRKTLVLPRNDPDFYRSILSLEEIDHILYSSRLRPGEIRISHAGEGVDLEQKNIFNLDVPLPIADIYREFVRGRTLVLHLLDQRWRPLGVVARMIERACRCMVRVNGYLTPPGEQGYPMHFDDHDFFIFQLDGVKRWKIFAPPPHLILPIKTRSKLPYGRTKISDAGEPVYDVDVRPGDLLYVPRGVPHYALAGDEPSLHMTVGLHGTTWHSLVESALIRAAAEESMLRENVPVRFSAGGKGAHDLSAAGRLSALLRDKLLDPRYGVDDWNSRRLEMDDPLPDGHFRSLAAAPKIDASTRLCRRDGVRGEVAIVEDRAVLRYMRKTVVRPAADEQLLRALTGPGPFTARDLPGSLSEAERVALARELIETGYLTIENPDIVDRRTKEREMNDFDTNDSVRPAGEHTAAGDSAVTPAGAGTPCCSSCAATGTGTPSRYVYAIGTISARFPSEDIEKETLQAVRGASTANLTDRQVLHRVLSDPANAYIAREMCWVFSVGQIDTYILVPRSGFELAELVDALKVNADPAANETSVVIGIRAAAAAPPSLCNGLALPVVSVTKVYTFGIGEFIAQIPDNENNLAARELLDRVTQIVDNVGELDEHRAINYLAMRYPAIYQLVTENFTKGRSMSGLTVTENFTKGRSMSGLTVTASGARSRRVVDVLFSFVDRNTDVNDTFMVRVDVTGQFPFLVTKLRPVFALAIGSCDERTR